MTDELSEAEIQRYARNILLPEVGGTGQARLRRARVLLVGAGGLGSPVALYLAAAGVGTLGLVDPDLVEMSNLQRQVAHRTDRIGRPKVESAAAAVQALNDGVVVEAHHARLVPGNARTLVGRYDLVCDCSDNFATRFLISDACVAERRTLVSAAAIRFSGQLSTFRPHRRSATDPAPCYRCLHPEPPPDEASCADAGVLGAVVGVMGTLQAAEAVKELLDIGQSLSGRLLLWDALPMRFRTVDLPRDPACPACGDRPAEHLVLGEPDHVVSV